MKRYAAVMAVLLAACGGQASEPAGGPAPQDGPMMGTGMGIMGGGGAPPVYALVGARERLSLTSEQVTALDSIGQALERENREVRRQLEERGFRPGNRPTQAQMDAARPLMERMRENNRRAMESVGALLSEQQKQAACALQQEARESRAGRRGDGGGGRRGGPGGPGGPGGRQGGRMGGRGGMMADSTMAGRARGWPWCPAPARQTPPQR